MQIDITNYDTLAASGRIQQSSWGDGHKQACLMSAVVAGARSEQDCVAAGWPLWLAELSVFLFDSYGSDYVKRGRDLMTAIDAADRRGVDWDRVFRDLRVRAILPIAMQSIGEVRKPWQQKCREIVKWSLANDGQAARAARTPWATEAAGAAWAAEAAEAAGAAGAAGAAETARAAWAGMAAWAAEAAGAAWAAEAAGAAGAGKALARDRIEQTLLELLA